MKNKKNILPLVIILITFGIIITGCDDNVTKDGDDLIGRWYAGQTLRTEVYEFKSNGTFNVLGGSFDCSYSVKGNVITTTYSTIQGTVKYKIEGNALTFSESSPLCSIAEVTVYR
ncbi:MAG: hypothetical protein LBH43_17675 [Treponema sp.]|jgi:hypothetical protein|nr:hypothetical protein [Treponema sp.]